MRKTLSKYKPKNPVYIPNQQGDIFGLDATTIKQQSFNQQRQKQLSHIKK